MAEPGALQAARLAVAGDAGRRLQLLPRPGSRGRGGPGGRCGEPAAPTSRPCCATAAAGSDAPLLRAAYAGRDERQLRGLVARGDRRHRGRAARHPRARAGERGAGAGAARRCCARPGRRPRSTRSPSSAGSTGSSRPTRSCSGVACAAHRLPLEASLAGVPARLRRQPGLGRHPPGPARPDAPASGSSRRSRPRSTTSAAAAMAGSLDDLGSAAPADRSALDGARDPVHEAVPLMTPRTARFASASAARSARARPRWSRRSASACATRYRARRRSPTTSTRARTRSS